MALNDYISSVRNLLNDPSLEVVQQVQSLWSGYGQIVRIKSNNTDFSAIVKVINLTQQHDHPRGWNTSASHQRKLRSYQVESHFYQAFAQFTDAHCLVPTLIASQQIGDGTLLVMEDLDNLGFTERKTTVSKGTLKTLISWLAHFHARFMFSDAQGLWPTGTYWHFGTRQDEWQKMPTGPFKQHAKQIDDVLHSAKYQTLLHGDAKVANFCFDAVRQKVAAVDFQYVGRGPGVKDLAYLLGSALDEEDLHACHPWVVNYYIEQLLNALAFYKTPVNGKELTNEITHLYPLAWADFYRFLLGWNPHSWKICGFMEDISIRAIKPYLR